MNTPAHLIFGAAAFGRPHLPRTLLAALAGSFAPDLSLYLMTAVSIWGLGIPPEIVFRDLYYSDAWQQVFAVDNSFVLWGLALGLAIRSRSAPAVAFTGAAFLHLAFDFPLHTHDARMHFWPLTDWRFESPVSYWDGRAYARIVESLVLVAVLALAVLIWRRFRTWAARIGTALLVSMEAMASGIWRIFF
ncbi:MAG: cobalamin biosynthesis protein CobQ [Paracoccaceae bacterium]|nr:cobalamin biosynthesis protein CobQ [Paracoccaceae bacterium]